MNMRLVTSIIENLFGPIVNLNDNWLNWVELPWGIIGL